MFDRTASTTLILLLGGAAMLAALNLGLAPSSPLHVPSYVVGLIGKYLCFAILALAIDLVWGFAGILSLGIVNKLLEPYAGAVLGKIVVLVLIILFIQKRPRGLFALKGRAVEA